MKWLATERDGAALAVFRMAFGALVSVSAIRFLAYGWVDTLFDTTFRFHYFGFGWIPWPGIAGVHALFIALVVLGVLVALGAFYRVSIVLLFVLFTWVQLLDVSNYLNHYYLVSLLALLLCFMPVHRLWSIDAWLRPSERRETIPWWCTVLLRFQVGAVYVFAALAKLNADWLLEGQPMSLWLAARTTLPIIGPVLALPAAPLIASWCGFLFDATIPFFLVWRRSRAFAYVAVLAFHLMTSALFPIGMFPFIMILSTLVFFDSSWPRRLVQTPAPLVKLHDEFPRWGVGLLTAWCALQVLLPLRAHLFGGNVSWHEQGMRFSWRVMTREKNGSVTFVIRDRTSSREWHVSPRSVLTPVQERELAVQPDLILQLAQHLGEEWKRKGFENVEVRADTWVSLNGRRARPLIDAQRDLLTVKDSALGYAEWIAD